MPRSPKASAEPGGGGAAGGGGGGPGAAGGGCQAGAVSKQPDPLEPGSASEEDDEDEILETSANGRWQKLNEQVARDVPGIDSAFLAMDTDDGVETVWNEVRYSNRKVVRGSKDRLVKILQRLTQVKHDNIVNFIDFWHDKVVNQDRLVFITEYMTSGSLLQFLNKAKITKKTISEKMWRRWCRQILAALSYLHKNEIVHGNLSLATIFIQHNGLVKIGSVSPDAIHEHVKTKIGETQRMHYTAPEYAGDGPIGTSADIFAFGICALEMLNLDLLGNGDGRPSPVKQEAIKRVVLELDPARRGFIGLCLEEDPTKRPRASSLLKHPVLQEVFTLKVLCALALSQRVTREKIESELDRQYNSQRDPDDVMAEVVRSGKELLLWKAHQVPLLDLDKFFEEITLDVVYHNDSRPLQTHSPPKEDDSSSRIDQPSSTSSNERNMSYSTQYYEKESRKVLSMTCNVQTVGGKKELNLRISFEDKMQRDMTSELKDDDDPHQLAWDLYHNGLISDDDRTGIAELILQSIQPMITEPVTAA